jgi:hypothetical protein
MRSSNMVSDSARPWCALSHPLLDLLSETCTVLRHLVPGRFDINRYYANALRILPRFRSESFPLNRFSRGAEQGMPANGLLLFHCLLRPEAHLQQRAQYRSLLIAFSFGWFCVSHYRYFLSCNPYMPSPLGKILRGRGHRLPRGCNP